VKINKILKIKRWRRRLFESFRLHCLLGPREKDLLWRCSDWVWGLHADVSMGLISTTPNRSLSFGLQVFLSSLKVLSLRHKSGEAFNEIRNASNGQALYWQNARSHVRVTVEISMEDTLVDVVPQSKNPSGSCLWLLRCWLSKVQIWRRTRWRFVIGVTYWSLRRMAGSALSLKMSDSVELHISRNVPSTPDRATKSAKEQGEGGHHVMGDLLVNRTIERLCSSKATKASISVSRDLKSAFRSSTRLWELHSKRRHSQRHQHSTALLIFAVQEWDMSAVLGSWSRQP
jgi:hypothetical protein